MTPQQFPQTASPYHPPQPTGGDPSGVLSPAGPGFSVGRPQGSGQPGYGQQGYGPRGAVGPYYPPVSGGQMMPGGGSPPGSPAGGNEAAVDIIGPILRRKFLVIFLGLIGLGISLLAYSSAEVIYGSTLQLLITSQAPPTVINGETLQQQVSIPQHLKLLGSQMILARAIEQGNLDRLQTFAGSIPEKMVSSIQKNVLKITPSKQDDQTLLLETQGKHPDDLPIILNAVVKAYQEEISRDTKTSGQESVELITKLRDQLEQEKQEAQESYLAILAKLDLPNIERTDSLVNPYNEDMQRVGEMRNAVAVELRDITNRLELTNLAISSNDPNRITHLVTEAKKYLGTAVETADTLEERRITNHELSRQVFQLERELNDLLIRRETAAQSMAKNHPLMASVNRRIQFANQQLTEAKTRYQQQSGSEPTTQDTAKTIEEKLESRNKTWVDVYRVALESDRNRLTYKQSQLDEELALVEKQAREIASDFSQLKVLQSRVTEKQKSIDDVLAKLAEINVVSNNFTDVKVRVIDPASQGARVAPSLLKYSAIGLFLGSLLGVGLAVLIDRADMTYRNPGEIFERLKVPVVCKLPSARMGRRQREGQANPALVCLNRPTSKLAEAVRAARTSLLFTAQSDGSKVFLFTSPSPGDGKSTATANLAISLAQAGKRVVLVDADFRRPRVHAYFGEAIEPGIAQATAGTLTLEECLRPSAQDGLSLLTCGGRPKNPGELVTSLEFAKLIGDLRERFDIVLIDSPPLLPVSDASVISSLVDGVYLVLRIRKGVVVTSSKAKEKLDMVNANLVGIIVNGVDDNPHYNEYGSYGYGYGYSYGYGYGNGSYYESRNSKYHERATTT